MYVFFCEYTIEPGEAYDHFRKWCGSDPVRWEGVERLESDSQPGLFVEIWRAADGEEAAAKQKERLDGRSGWGEMEKWVKGGRDGLKCWTFRDVSSGK